MSAPWRALVMLVFFSAALAGCGGDSERGGDTTTTTDGTTTTNEATTTTAADRAQDEIVAVDDQGRALVLDATTGEQVRVLLEGVRVDDPVKNGVSLSPDGQHAFVVRPSAADEPASDAEIVRLAVDGGEPEVVAEGLTPAVSPRGDTLAYTTVDPSEGPALPEPVLVLRDLRTNEELRLTREQEPDLQFIGDLAWTADGSEVVFTAGEIVMGMYTIPTDATSLDQARRVGPTSREEGASWRAVTALDGDRMAVVETCCDLPEPERWSVVAVNLAEGTVEGGVLPDERTEVTWLDGDGEEGRLLLVVNGEPGNRTLMRWDGSGAPTPVADGIVVAAW